MSSDTQIRAASQLAPEPVTVTGLQAQGALSPTSGAHLMAAYLQFDAYDAYVTGRSVLGWSAGERFLEIVGRPGHALEDPPIPFRA